MDTFVLAILGIALILFLNRLAKNMAEAQRQAQAVQRMRESGFKHGGFRWPDEEVR